MNNMRRYNVLWLLVLGALAAGIRSHARRISPASRRGVHAGRRSDSPVVLSSTPRRRRKSLVAQLTRRKIIALAQSRSINPTASTGGLLGGLDSGTTPPVLKDALVGVAPGQRVRSFGSLRDRHPEGDRRDDPVNTNMNASCSRLAGHTSGCERMSIDVSGLVEAEAILQAFPKSRLEPDPCDLPGASPVSARPGDRWKTTCRRRKGRPPLTAGFRRHAGPLRPGSTPCVSRPDGSRARSVSPGLRCGPCQLPAATLRMEEALGVAYLHKVRNGERRLSRAGRDLLVPIAAGRPYARTGDSERAIEHFLRYLQRQPDDLEVRWLLNLAYMTLGRYPDEVPPAYLIPPRHSRPRRRRAFPRRGAASRPERRRDGGRRHRGRLRRHRALRRRHVQLRQLRPDALFPQQR